MSGQPTTLHPEYTGPARWDLQPATLYPDTTLLVKRADYPETGAWVTFVDSRSERDHRLLRDDPRAKVTVCRRPVNPWRYADGTGTPCTMCLAGDPRTSVATPPALDQGQLHYAAGQLAAVIQERNDLLAERAALKENQAALSRFADDWEKWGLTWKARYEEHQRALADSWADSDKLTARLSGVLQLADRLEAGPPAGWDLEMIVGELRKAVIG